MQLARYFNRKLRGKKRSDQRERKWSEWLMVATVIENNAVKDRCGRQKWSDEEAPELEQEAAFKDAYRMTLEMAWFWENSWGCVYLRIEDKIFGSDWLQAIENYVKLTRWVDSVVCTVLVQSGQFDHTGLEDTEESQMLNWLVRSAWLMTGNIF